MKINNDNHVNAPVIKSIHACNDDVKDAICRANEEFAWIVRYFQQRIQRLERSNRDLEAFNYSVSHDLRAPLRHIQGLGAVLQEDHLEGLDPKGQELLQRICSESSRMEVIINDVLQLSMVSGAEMRITRISLTELAHAVVAMHRDTEPGRKVDIRIDEGVWARGDATLLRILMENLIGNAWKYTSKRSVAEIRVGKAMARGMDAFFVGDNGVGFDMAEAGLIYEPFHRLHCTGEYDGNGIGLSTARRIVLRHRGEIWADSEKEKGATFYFTLSL